MNLTVFYVGQAIAGTSQEGKTEIDTKKLQKWLEEFAKIIMGRASKLWLKSIDLESLEDIEAAVVEYLEIYHKKEAV